MAGIRDNEKAEISKFSDFRAAQSINPDFLVAYASVGKADASFNVSSDGVLLWVLILYITNKRFVRSELLAHFHHICQYSLLAGHSGKCRMYNCTRKAVL